MPRFGSSPLAFPDFKGATRRLILINLATYFALLVAGFASSAAVRIAGSLVFDPTDFMHGWLWQPFTYSFVHIGILATAFELLSLWFLAGFLEAFHDSNWVTSLYAVSVLGTAAAALVLYLVSKTLAPSLLTNVSPLYGCFGGIFGLLVAIGVLYGDTQFLLFFVIGIKARYMAILYALIAIAMLFGQERMYAFAQLGGALAGWAFVRMAPRRGMSFMLSESWYGVRNRYYRWKRRRAARKFEVYMRSQGRTVKFDGQGRLIDEDPDDKKRWN
ncbi:MAG TPA: rhomboid family intramembrane serine protease [Terracidiphilus sp.]|jgi:membrane associated rhomboid family serine protease